MPLVTLAHEEDLAGWRTAARALAVAEVPPGEVTWEVGGGAPDLFAAPPAESPAFSVPRAFLTLAETVIRHPDPERFSLLYAILLRLKARAQAMDEGDPLLRRLEAMAKAVRRSDIRRKLGGAALVPGQRDEMAQARGQIGDNLAKSWEAVRAEAIGCTRCHLYKYGTQTVFGEGPLDAKILFVGEQPGDQEDLAGRPFVGPAGQLFDRALAEAGVDRSAAYVTNAVKHFKFEKRGKRRIHSKPDGREIEACRWWLEQERMLIRPPLTVALGATAARSLFGKVVTIASLRGSPHDIPDGGEGWVTVHPSFLLRVRDNKEAEYARFVADLHRIGERAKALA